MEKEGGKFENELMNNDNVLKRKCFIAFISKAWCAIK